MVLTLASTVAAPGGTGVPPVTACDDHDGQDARPRYGSRAFTGALASLAFAFACSGCVAFEDRCVDVRCDEGEICVDREPAPVCVCDDAHELDDDGVCVAIEDDGGE